MRTFGHAKTVLSSDASDMPKAADLALVYEVPLDTLAVWETYRATPTLDAVNGGTKLSRGAEGNSSTLHRRAIPGGPYDMTGKWIKYSVYMWPGAGSDAGGESPDRFSVFYVRLHTLTAGGWNTYTRVKLRHFYSAGDYFEGDRGLYTGWVHVDDSTDSAGNLASIDGISIDINTRANDDACDCTIVSVEVFTPPATYVPPFAICSDDGFDTVLDLAALLEARDLVATHYVLPGLISTTGQYLGGETLATAAELRDLKQRLGHLIANHSWTHTAWDTLTASQRRLEITRAADWLTENGFADGSRIFALPYGSFHWEIVDDVMLGVEADQVRLTNYKTPYHTEQGGPLVYAPIFVDVDGDFAAADQLLADCIAMKLPCILGFHNIADLTEATLITFLDAVETARDAGTIRVVTTDGMF